MYRLIKYSNQYESDNFNFSDCSTRYEVLPILATTLDEAKKELKRYKKELFINERGGYMTIGAAIDSGEVNSKGHKIYLGFIKLPDYTTIPALQSVDNPIDGNLLYEAINYGIYLDAIQIDGENRLLIGSWRAFHELQLLGYQNFDSMLETHGIDSSVFDDSVFRCSGCGEWDYNDSGYTYNYRIVGCEIYGLHCCDGLKEAQLEEIDSFINDSSKFIDDSVIEALGEKIRKINTYIGGMVDGRGGYIGGQRVDEGDPKTVLEKYLKKNPNKQYLFGVDESGQFQTYFSIYELK